MSDTSFGALRPLSVAEDPRHRRIAAAPAGTFVQALLASRARLALAASVLCFAAIHVAILLVHVAFHGDAAALNVFTMLEAQRLWPALASGAAARGWSLVFGMAVYGVVFAALPGRSWPGIVRPAAPRARVLDRAAEGVSVGLGAFALVLGLTVHMTALAAIGRLVRTFPPVPDVVHASLPYVDFGLPGELCFAAFMLAMITVLCRTQPKTVPVVLVLLGVFYAVRGVFLFLLPIGSPPTAPPLTARFVFWPFATHAYFPGGHTGMMTVLSLSVASRAWRRAFLVATGAFAFGTLLARTHYAADAVGGWLVGYTIVMWGRRRFGALAGGIAARTPACAPTAARQPSED